MPTVASGYRSTGTGIKSDRLRIEMEDKIYQYDPNKTPMLTLLSMSSGSRASNADFNHLEDEPLPEWDTLTVNLSSGATGTITVAHGTYFRAGDLVLIPTSLANSKAEVVLVTGVATNTVSVTRDWVNNNSGTGGTAAVSGDNVLIIGNVNEEAAGTRTIASTTEAVVTNYCQIIRTPFGVSGTLDATATYGPGDYKYQASKSATQHAFEQERAFLFGTKRKTTGTAGRPIRATGGILYWLSTNSVAAGGNLTHSTMESLAEKCFRYGNGNPKVFLVSRRIMSQLDNIAESRIQTVPSAETYGVHMKRYVTGHGDLLVKVHDFLKNDFAGTGLVIDMAQLEKRYTVNQEGKRDNLLRTNIQDNDADARSDEYLSEIGLHIHLEKAHGIVTGVTA